MNAIIETINSAGRTFVEFALPMLIQSSVLILILLALDVLLRRRVRALFRYWIWMLVLVKLVLPPSLWSPVSIGTWLGDELASPALTPHEAPSLPHAPVPAQWQPPVALNWIQEMQTSAPGVASASDRLPMEALRVPTPEGPLSGPDTRSLPAPALRWPAVVLLVWLAVASALLLLLFQRAWFVRGLVAQTREAPPRLQAALDQCRRRMGVARPIPLRLSPNATSPAVCGLLRPVILIPENLAPRLQPHELQAVVLHELAHVKRGDLWVNLIQTLLQIVYFYNPLLWLANAMIRRVREQAVDEAVLVAMGETAPDYPETLLHVAKLAFHRRPALSLRLIGVVESKSALRSRIKHILARPLPKTAKLGLLGLVAVFLIAAVLLPMAKARPLTDRARSVMALADEEARRFNHDYVGTEHILLALARQENAVSAKVLANLGADLDTLRAEVNKLVRPGAEPVTRSTLPRMPRAERAMQNAKEEARTLGHDYIGTEHILLALLRDKDSVAAQTLASLGITQTQVRAQVLTFVQPGRRDAEDNNDEGAGGGALVEPAEGNGTLEFRIVAGRDDLAPELLGEYRRMLVEKRTLPDRRYRWFPVRSGTNPPFDSVAENCDRATYLLLWNEPSHAMLASQAWELKKVERATDAMGRAAIRLVLDEDGALLFQQITAANANRALAIVLDGKVVAAPHIAMPFAGAEVLIVGNFADQEIDGMIARLRRSAAGMVRVLQAEGDHWVILDLATGAVVTSPKALPASEVAKGIGDLGKGDLAYEVKDGNRRLLLLRGATSVKAQQGPAEPFGGQAYRIGPQLPQSLIVTTAEGRQYKVTIRAADDKSCTLKFLLPPDLDDSGGALVEPTEAQSSGVVAKLPNGVTVEFLAYSQLTSEGLRWWTPEGKPTTIPGLYEADVEGHGTLLALRIEPEPEAGVSAWRVQPPNVRDQLKPVWQPHNSNVWLVPLGEERSYANVEITAQVRDAVVIKPIAMDQLAASASGEIGACGLWIKYLAQAEPEVTAFAVYGTLSYSAMPAGPKVLAAIDTAGHAHAVHRMLSSSFEEQMAEPFGGPLRLQVDLPTDHLAAIVVEGYSERAGTVTFHNLSLRPSQPTEVHIEVEAEQRGPWWHPSEYDANLEHLGRVLSEQAEARGGRYPADLAALQAYFTDTQWNWLQEHAVYLVASEPATKAETVPLAYEKTLLPAGFGTYVLFGDGAVRFRTPGELVQLAITQANRTVPRPTLSPQPVNQTKADAVALPAVKAELPNGVTVEFLAYSHLVPSSGLQWLNPQGQETTIPGVYEADVDGLGTILALRVQPPEAHLVAQLYRGPDSQNIEKQWQLPGTAIWLLPLRDERSFANLRVLTQWTEPPAIETIPLTEENLGQLVAVNRYGIASIVDLQVVESFSADMLMNEMGQPSILGTGVATAESMGLQDVAEPPMLQFSYLRERGSFQKVAAFLDKEGRTHPIEQGKVDSTGTTCQGRIWPGRLAGILVEASAVSAADVRFRNVSLMPERITEIQIEPAASQEMLWKLSYRHFVLEALTNSLHEFCERHGGRFPGSLADLQSSHDPDAFRWISTHMAYIGQGKSLDDDPRSVVAYDKTLLAEGRGTYVLYSDGRVEFEGPVELAELGILPANQGGISPSSADPSSGDGVGSNATGEPRFTVYGAVTDASGRPMEGVWVNVDCGFERPQRAGRTLTDEEGRYTLGFESAWVVADADPYGVGIQPAFVYARKDGFYETSLCHKGNLAMAGRAPGPDEQRFVAGRAGVVLANEPYELNFVMAPAAVLTGQLVDADGRPIANRGICLHGDQIYPPGHSYTHVRTRSDGTFGPCTVPCTSFHLSCPELRLAPNDEITFARAGNWRLTLKRPQTGSQTAQLLVEDLQGPTDGSPNPSSTVSQATAVGLSGRVVDPNGAPVAGAQVAWIDAERSVSITDGRLMEPRFGDRGKGPIIETDERGYFRFEEEPNDGFSLLAAHDAGFALVGSEQFARDRVVRLQRWGRIEGRVAEGREPLEDNIWMGGLPNSTWFEHRRDYRYETLCDAQGRFTFKRVPPGWFEVGYLTRMGDSVSSHTSRTPILVESGRTATMTLGGEGRPVIGRFVPPPDWEGPIYFGAGFRALDTVRPDPPRPADYDQMTQREQQRWLKRWYETPEAREYRDALWHDLDQRHYTFRIRDDGTFRIEDVIPGKYNFTVWLEERLSGGGPEEFGGYSGTIEVPPMDQAYSDESLDVGDLVLKLRRPLHVGDLAPLFEAQTLDGKDIRLADYRGRFVLLSFWHPASHPELDRLKELHATYGRTGRLQIIGLGGSDTLDEVKKFVAEQAVLWPQIYFGQAWDQGIAQQYGLSGLPCILLIDPEGKIVATWLREQKLTDTVREALTAFTHD